MGQRELVRLLAERGTDLSVWPDRDRAAARRLMRRSPAARARYLAALAADPALEDAAALVEPARNARMRETVLRRLAAYGAPVRSPVRSAAPAWPAPALRWGALGAAALLGIWIGWADRPQPTTTLLAALQLTPFSDQGP